MALITANQRQNAIAKEQTALKTTWAKVISDLTRETDLLIKLVAWKNKKFLDGSGDFDAEDMTLLAAKSNTVITKLNANIAKLEEIAEIPDVDLAVYATNNDAFIAKYGVDVADFDKRYQV